MNALTTTSNNAVANVSDADPWAQALAADGGSTGKFLKFDGNTGDFLYGPENDQKELAHGTRMVIDMTAYQQGYICWNDEEVVDEVMEAVLINPTGPDKNALHDHGPYKGKRDGWKAQRAFNMLGGEEDDLFNFKTSSGGGRRGCKNFLESFVKEYRKHPGKFPVVTLGSVTFETKDEDGKKAGKKHAPTFTIVGWFAQSDYEEMATAAAKPDEDEPEEGDSNDEANYEQTPEPVVETPPAPVSEPVADPTPATGRRAKRF